MHALTPVLLNTVESVLINIGEISQQREKPQTPMEDTSRLLSTREVNFHEKRILASCEAGLKNNIVILIQNKFLM